MKNEKLETIKKKIKKHTPKIVAITGVITGSILTIIVANEQANRKRTNRDVRGTVVVTQSAWQALQDGDAAVYKLEGEKYYLAREDSVFVSKCQN